MKYTMRGAAVMKTGPNNARCVVWAISESFFFLSSFFLKPTDIYSIYNCNL